MDEASGRHDLIEEENQENFSTDFKCLFKKMNSVREKAMVKNLFVPPLGIKKWLKNKNMNRALMLGSVL